MAAGTPPHPDASSGRSVAPDGELLNGRYRLERRIGQGGMAEVWVATDIDLDRRVAVKLLKSNLASDPVVAERFRREAIAVARLTHPNIVAVHDVCSHEGRQAVVMQLVDGKSLRQILDSQRRLGPELTIHVGASIAGALDEAHRAGLVHRDVKPGNILVTTDGRVLLTDFGIAKGVVSGEEDLTSDNVMMGTAKYLSPEQVRGRQLDGRADLYSLALVLYECLAGCVPFLGESDADTALARLQRDPTDLAHLRPTLPIGLVNLIHRTLARNPDHRPPSGADLRAALHSVDTTPPQFDGTPADPPPRIADPPTRARDAGPGIPGEPHMPVVGVGPTRADITPVASPPDGRRPTRDVTPAAVRPLRGTPSRRNSHRWTPSMVVVGMLLMSALVVAGILLLRLNRGDDPMTGATITVAPVGPSDVGQGPVATIDPGDTVSGGASDPVDSGPVSIVSVRAWDPDGDNGTENDAQARLALADGQSSTFWATECYQDRYLGGKRGVGLIMSLSRAATGTLRGSVTSAPYQVDVFVSSAPEPPSDLGGWERLGDTRFGETPVTLGVDIVQPVSHILVWFKELGPDDACSSANPYRGLLDEVSFGS